MPNPLRIVGLQVENFKKVKAVSIVPKGDLIQISGKNGAGKTSVLDAIWAALGGKEQIPDVPVRTGEDKCKIRLDLGELVVSRTIDAKGSTLTVESPEGARFKSPQTMLDALMGSMTFDPLSFTRLKAKEQADELRKVSEIAIDLDKIDAENKFDFDTRTAVGRDAKAARAAAESIEIGDAAERIDTKLILDRIMNVSTEIQALETESSRRACLVTELFKQEERLLKLRRELEDVTAWCATTKAHLDSLPAMAPTPDLVSLREELDTAEASNRVASQLEEKAKLRGEHIDRAKALENTYEQLTKAIEARTKAKDDALKAAKMPVPGLGFQDGIVTFNGVPFSQSSAAEQLRVSTAIAMAANPRLRVIRITDGSLLDDNSMAILEAMAHEHGYQIWIEMVDSTGKVGIHIEEGCVKADNQIVALLTTSTPPPPPPPPAETTPPDRMRALEEANRIAFGGE